MNESIPSHSHETRWRWRNETANTNWSFFLSPGKKRSWTSCFSGLTTSLFLWSSYFRPSSYGRATSVPPSYSPHSMEYELMVLTSLLSVEPFLDFWLMKILWTSGPVEWKSSLGFYGKSFVLIWRAPEQWQNKEWAWKFFDPLSLAPLLPNLSRAAFAPSHLEVASLRAFTSIFWIWANKKCKSVEWTSPSSAIISLRLGSKLLFWMLVD